MKKFVLVIAVSLLTMKLQDWKQIILKCILIMKKYLGNNTRIDHIAIAVKDIDEALFFYQDLPFLVLDFERHELLWQYRWL